MQKAGFFSGCLLLPPRNQIGKQTHIPGFMSKILYFLAPFLLWACGQKSAPAASPEMPADFLEFYQRFHIDSAYQVGHIIFPLEGLPDHADSLTIASGTFRWQPEDWLMQRPFDFGMSDYMRDLQLVADNVIQERIVHKNGETGMVRRFARLGGEWYLIYYAGMNLISKPGN
ncbi:MAG: hypothetical protein RI973_2166 [Bacteroidota bacterium]